MNTDATAESIERLWDAATRENSDYYVRQFSRIREKGGFAVSWNWPAFFFGMFWLVYRGMYLYAVLAFVGWIPIHGLALMVLGESEAVYWGTTLVVMVVIGAVANALYLRHVTQRIAREAAKHPQVADQLESLWSGRATHSGLTVGAVILVFGVGAAPVIVGTAYRDYTVRSQIVDGFELVSRVRASMEEFRAVQGRWPEDDVELGVGYVRGDYVTSIEIDGPRLVIIYGNAADPLIVGKRVEWLAEEDAAGAVSWRCGFAGTSRAPVRHTTVVPQFLPRECRRS
jgi:hypothetical protein